MACGSQKVGLAGIKLMSHSANFMCMMISISTTKEKPIGTVESTTAKKPAIFMVEMCKSCYYASDKN